MTTMTPNAEEKVLIVVRDLCGEGFLGARAEGEKVRKAIEKALANEKKIILDFKGISNITQSFGDEVLGILTRAFGLPFIRENIGVINANEKVKLILNWVVKYSQRIYKQSGTKENPHQILREYLRQEAFERTV